jgi:DNA methylase
MILDRIMYQPESWAEGPIKLTPIRGFGERMRVGTPRHADLKVPAAALFGSGEASFPVTHIPFPEKCRLEEKLKCEMLYDVAASAEECEPGQNDHGAEMAGEFLLMSMTNKVRGGSHRSDAGERSASLNAICPYYTMFPLDFPLSVLKRYGRKKLRVLDPFCGRGTTIFAARLKGQQSFGIDCSAIAIAIARAKLAETTDGDVLSLAAKILDRSC